VKDLLAASCLLLLAPCLTAKDLPFLPEVELGELRDTAETQYQGTMAVAQCEYTDGHVSLIRLSTPDKAPLDEVSAGHLVTGYTDAHETGGQPPEKILISLGRAIWLWPVHDQVVPEDTLALLSNGKLSISSIKTRMAMAKAGDKESQVAVEALIPAFPVIPIGITRGEAETILGASAGAVTASRGGVTTTFRIENGAVAGVSYHKEKPITEAERDRLLSGISGGEPWAKTHLPQLAWRWPIHLDVEPGDHLCTEGEHDLVVFIAKKALKANVGSEKPKPSPAEQPAH